MDTAATQNQVQHRTPYIKRIVTSGVSRLHPIHNDDLLHSLRHLFSVQVKPQYYDTVFEVQQKGCETINIYVTRAILYVTCNYLADLLRKQENSAVVHVPILDVDAETFSQIIEYCFTGDMTSVDPDTMIRVIQYANNINFEKARVKAETKLTILQRFMSSTSAGFSLDTIMSDDDTKPPEPKRPRRKSIHHAVTPKEKKKTPVLRSESKRKIHKRTQESPNIPTKQEQPAPAQTEEVKKEGTEEHFIEFKVGEKVYCKYQNHLFLCKVCLTIVV
jgi:hypothetical protein